jgi:hypothetical protein
MPGHERRDRRIYLWVTSRSGNFPAVDFREHQQLRGRVRELLRELSVLPGFEARRASLPEPPGAFRKVPWHAVLAQIDGAERDTALWMRPHAPTSREEMYAKAVLDFAEEFVFGAEWSARALHSALQANGPIGLPPGRPGPWYRAGHALRIDVQAGDTIPAFQREQVVAFLDQLVRVTPAQPATEDTTKARLRKEARRSPQVNRHVEAVEDYERQFIAPPGPRSGHRSFDTNARHALDGIRSRLDGVPLSDVQRQGLRRLGRHLNAAVNGEYDAPVPLEPSDASAGVRIRLRERRALAASTASAQIRRARRGPRRPPARGR